MRKPVTNRFPNSISALREVSRFRTIYLQQSEVSGKMLLRSIVVSFCLHQAWGQTQIDLQAQSKNVDFTSSPTTRPLKSGVTLPGTCTVGEMFFLTNAVAGANLYGCASANSWTIESSGGGG